MHGVIVQRTLRKQNSKSTPCSDHFWRLRCWKNARRCGAKQTSKSKWAHFGCSPLFFVAGARDFAPCHKGAKREGLLQLQLQLHHDYNYNYHHHYHYKPLPWHYNYSYNCDCHYHYTTLHYATLNYTTPAYTTPTATATTPTATQPQLQLQLHLQLQLQLHCTRLGFSYPTLRHTLLDYTALQLQLQLQLRYSYNYSKYNYNCTTPGYNYTTLHIDRHPQLKRH